LNIPLPQSVRNNGSLYMHVFLAAADWGKAKERENKQGTGLWINLMQDPFSVNSFAKLTQYRVPQAETFRLLGDKDTKSPEDNVKYYFATFAKI
jgi:Cleft lip and palate transmembrane protein 1 (CLPTM1)